MLLSSWSSFFDRSLIGLPLVGDSYFACRYPAHHVSPLDVARSFDSAVAPTLGRAGSVALLLQPGFAPIFPRH